MLSRLTGIPLTLSLGGSFTSFQCETLCFSSLRNCPFLVAGNGAGSVKWPVGCCGKMGGANSKAEKIEAFRLCSERRRYIKQAIDSRDSLAAAHVSYIESLRSIGTALRRFAEAEVVMESSLSTSAAEAELDKSPSHSSHPSPSPSHSGAHVSKSPLQDRCPVSPNLSYMRTAGNVAAVTVTVNPQSASVKVDGSSAIPLPPPRPPFEVGSSWDYFDPGDDGESFRFVAHDVADVGFEDVTELGELGDEGLDHRSGKHDLYVKLESGEEVVGIRSREKALELSGNLAAINHGSVGSDKGVCGDAKQRVMHSDTGLLTDLSPDKDGLQLSDLKRERSASEKDLCDEREDPSEFITHRAKDFLSSIKDIEHRFVRASEAGKEVSRMLESNKIKVGYSDTKGRSSALAVFSAFQTVCGNRKPALISQEPGHVTKIITWKRTISSRSSASRNPLAPASKDDCDDSESDFMEEFCMITGSHSSTLDRLYAWERKLYDEVKASECIRQEYDRKCDQLRHQFAKDYSTQAIDKTRAVVKDLHSRIRVALHSVDSISRRIEKMRDEELQPQLLELMQGLTRMWKAMLECHHAQYITISLAYHSRSSSTPQADSRRETLGQLQQEVECFGLSFTNWVNSHAAYVESLNGWLQNCILEPQGRSKQRRPFSPRRVVAPPIFVLCRDWCAGIKSLPSEALSSAIRDFLCDVQHMMEEPPQQAEKKYEALEAKGGEMGSKDGEKSDDILLSNLCTVQASLTKVLDRLNKFSEASLKMYEDVRYGSEAARVAYSNCGPTRF